jgi:hypothetical protein
MNRDLCKFIVACLILALSAAALAGPSVEIRLQDGSKWRGQVSDVVQVTFLEQNIEVKLTGRLMKVADLYIILEADIAGSIRNKTIFRGDIVAMSTVDAGREQPADAATKKIRAERDAPGRSRADAPASPDDRAQCVYVLPMEGMVGTYMRHEEVVKIGEHADEAGRGQIIVLIFDSGGGGVEMENIHNAILDLKKRHRVIAWIKSAMSAAAASAIACDEIYFMKEGTLGAMTGYVGDSALSGKELEDWKRTAGEWMEDGGRNKWIAWSMIHAKDMLSYDKDPVTGEVTWYNDMSGEFDLSDDKSNLVFDSRTAVNSGFAQGVADTPEELAKLLDLPEWCEADDYGRRIFQEWHDLCERCEKAIPELMRDRELAGAAPTPAARLGKLIQIDKQLLQWWERCPNVCEMALPPKKVIEREIEELKRELARLRGG